jgi:hypothetical protein
MLKNQAEALELIAEIKDKLADRLSILEVQSHPVAQAMPVLVQLFCELQKVIGGPANLAVEKGLEVARQVGGAHKPATQTASEAEDLVAMIAKLGRLKEIVLNDQEPATPLG